MSIVVRFSPVALTAKTYDETIRQIKNAGEIVRQLGAWFPRRV